jgi:hypothetical protein
MTDFTSQIAFAVPENHMSGMNSLVAIMNGKEADKRTFKLCKWENSLGDLFSFVCFPVSSTFLSGLSSFPENTVDFTVDQQAAQAAFDILQERNHLNRAARSTKILYMTLENTGSAASIAMDAMGLSEGAGNE